MSYHVGPPPYILFGFPPVCTLVGPFEMQKAGDGFGLAEKVTGLCPTLIMSFSAKEAHLYADSGE